MSRDRVLALDGLRGFALLGILFGNLTWFTGYAVLSPEARQVMATAPLDSVATWSIHFFVDGKFYGVFSMLFGAGFTILAEHATARGQGVPSVLARRLGILLILGLLHAILLWFGDIVSLYAGIGMALLLFRRVSERGLLVAAAVLFAIPVSLAGLWTLLSVAPPPYGPYELLPEFGSGNYADAVAVNWEFLKGRWEQAAHSGRPFKLLGLFLLGAWAVRRGLALRPEDNVEQLRRLLGWGLVIGIPANVALAALKTTSGGPAVAFSLATVDAIAVPSLAIGYSAGVLLLFVRVETRRRLAWLALPGRMTLTHYLIQSVIGVIVFYGYGFGCWGRIGAVWIIPITLTIFLGQCAFSAWWLRRHRQGPVEGLWRRLSDRRDERGEVPA